MRVASRFIAYLYGQSASLSEKENSALHVAARNLATDFPRRFTSDTEDELNCGCSYFYMWQAFQRRFKIQHSSNYRLSLYRTDSLHKVLQSLHLNCL